MMAREKGASSHQLSKGAFTKQKNCSLNIFSRAIRLIKKNPIPCRDSTRYLRQPKKIKQSFH